MCIHIIHICNLIPDSGDRPVDYTHAFHGVCIVACVYSMAKVCHCDSCKTLTQYFWSLLFLMPTWQEYL